MKVLSWNVGEMRWRESAKFLEVLRAENPDVIALQEPKAIDADLANRTLSSLGYHPFAPTGVTVKTCVVTYAKNAKLLTLPQLGCSFDERRLVAVKVGETTLLNVYVPNAMTKKTENKELRVRAKRSVVQEVAAFVSSLHADVPVLVCGDFNVAHGPLDLHHDNTPPGAKPWERALIDEILRAGTVDVFRHLHPNTREYTHWHNVKCRVANRGWRLDYTFISRAHIGRVHDIRHVAGIVEGRGHCPLVVDIRDM